ncbi:MAG: HEPN domain-containing protein [Candidatus Methylomirabilota bacterium]|jgi:HEPN domain-containing protein
MHEPGEIARAFLSESDVDYRVAQLLRGTEFHSRTIAFAQQAVEKLVKACLALRGVVTLEHNLSSLFRALYQADLPDMDELVKHIEDLERHGARPRFPLFQRRDLPLWVPSRDYREEDATRAMYSAEYVVQRVKPHVQRILG